MPEAPRILRLEWGTVGVEGHDDEFKDVKVHPDGAREWDWNETGTHHAPGVQPADIQELLHHGAEVVVLSRGMWKRLNVTPEAERMLEARGVEYHVLPTKKAVETYNHLARDRPAAALIHSTC